MKFTAIMFLLFSAMNSILEASAEMGSYVAANKTCYEELYNEKNQYAFYRCQFKCVLEKMSLTNSEGVPIIENYPSHLKPYLEPCIGEIDDKQVKDLGVCYVVTVMGQCVWDSVVNATLKMAQECATETKTDVNVDDNRDSFLRAYPGDIKNVAHAPLNQCILKKLNVIGEDNVFMLDEYVPILADVNVDMKKYEKDCVEKNQQEDKNVQAMNQIYCLGESIINRLKEINFVH